ncbi:MAG TPA: hypothetical protein VEH80_04020 [Candidatus Bathyarchaeia archaeon]|nr:hypothetical protein [Candidatus Bathyarchaeia archaeon]
MRDRNYLPLLLGLVVVITGCATQREWATWRAHSTHFATDNHLSFSVSSAAAGAPRITPEMVERAKAEGWWGRNVPSDARLADVQGEWEGEWIGHGIWRSDRGGIARASFTLRGAVGEGQLAMIDSQVAEGVPLSLRESSSFGAAVKIVVGENEVWVNGADPKRPFAASFTLQGDRLVGTFLYTDAPVQIEMTRRR